MNALLSATFAVAGSIGACIAAASVASLVLAKAAPPAFAGLDSPDLWTAKAFRIDPGKQRSVEAQSKYPKPNAVEQALTAYPTIQIVRSAISGHGRRKPFVAFALGGALLRRQAFWSDTVIDLASAGYLSPDLARCLLPETGPGG